MDNEYKTYVLREFKVNHEMLAKMEDERQVKNSEWVDGFFRGRQNVYKAKIEIMEAEFPWLADFQESENILNC